MSAFFEKNNLARLRDAATCMYSLSLSLDVLFIIKILDVGHSGGGQRCSQNLEPAGTKEIALLNPLFCFDLMPVSLNQHGSNGGEKKNSEVLRRHLRQGGVLFEGRKRAGGGKG